MYVHVRSCTACSPLYYDDIKQALLVVAVADVFAWTAACTVATFLSALGESARWLGVVVLSPV